MATNSEDKRLTEVKSEEQAALTEAEHSISNRLDTVQQGFQNLQDRVDASTAEQEKVLNEQTDFAIKKLEQQEEYAKKDYIKEQSGAYVDWQKQSNKYGANAEQMAAQGLTNTGYSETSQVSMYNQYQNRVAIARESFERTKTEFATAMTEARIQNSVALAEIAAKANEQKLQFMLQSLLQVDALRGELEDRKLAIKSHYNTKYQNVLDQINTEDALQLEKEKFDWEKDQVGNQGGNGTFDDGNAGDDGGNTGNNESGSEENTELKKLENADWALEDDGGINWFWGIDRNAKYSDGTNTYTGAQLVRKLKKLGMSTEDAKNYVKALQQRAGATK